MFTLAYRTESIKSEMNRVIVSRFDFSWMLLSDIFLCDKRGENCKRPTLIQYKSMNRFACIIFIIHAITTKSVLLSLDVFFFSLFNFFFNIQNIFLQSQYDNHFFCFCFVLFHFVQVVLFLFSWGACGECCMPLSLSHIATNRIATKNKKHKSRKNEKK